MNLTDMARSDGSLYPVSKMARLTRLGGKSASIVVMIALLLGTLVASPSQAAESCTKANAVKVVSGTKFVCKKVSGKLQWAKQGSNAVVNNQPSAPTTTTAKEWSKCPTAGKVSGTGDKTMSCVKVEGKLQWVKNTTLDTPIPSRPCRTEGQIGDWRGEVLLCTPASSGKTWQIPAFESTAPTKFVLSSPSCHSTGTRAVVETFEAGEWNFEDYATLIQGLDCPTGFGRYERTVELSPGARVRFRVYTSRWSVATVPVTADSSRNIVLSIYERVLLTPATSRVTITDKVGNAYVGIDFVNYEEESQESVFTFRVSSDIQYRGVTNFRTSRGLTPITLQPSTLGYFYRAGTTFEIRVRKDAIQWDLSEFDMDLSGSQGVNQFVKNIKVNFTWR